MFHYDFASVFFKAPFSPLKLDQSVKNWKIKTNATSGTVSRSSRSIARSPATPRAATSTTPTRWRSCHWSRRAAKWLLPGADLLVSFYSLRFPTEHIDTKCSLESKLHFEYTCSIRIIIRKEVISEIKRIINNRETMAIIIETIATIHKFVDRRINSTMVAAVVR